MNGRVAKLIRKDAGFEPHNPDQRKLFWHKDGRHVIAGHNRTLYQMLKKEYVYGKAQRKAEALLRTRKGQGTVLRP